MVKGEGKGRQFIRNKATMHGLIYNRTGEQIRDYVWVHTWRNVWRLGCREPWVDVCRQINEVEQPW